MKEVIAYDLNFMGEVKHLVAAFYDFEHDTVYWAPQCQCGSVVDENHKCLAMWAEQGAANVGTN